MSTLILQRKEVARLLNIEECMDAVEHAFRLLANGQASPPKVLGVHAEDGGFHIKAGLLGTEKSYFVTKINANFPGNPRQNGLPTIQGIIAVFDAVNGRILALLDSIEITIIRTGAATGIAAKYLSVPNATVATICGCGNQGAISLKALMKVRQLKKIYAFDISNEQRERFARNFKDQLTIIPIDKNELSSALKESHIIVTCTTSREPFIDRKDISPGTFIAAVGADSEDKQELLSDLVASNKLVVDLADQCAAFGELHHAIEQGLTTISKIHSELGSIVAEKKPGRESKDEIIIFDSTGIGLQDVAAAALVYEKAMALQLGRSVDFSEYEDVATLKQKKSLDSLRSWFPFK